MGMVMQSVMVMSIAACIVSVAYAAEGTATFYNPPYVPSACYGYRQQGIMIAAASNVFWNNKGACGKMYRVRCIGATRAGVPQPCKGNSVVVKIVDHCPTGCGGTIDLSRDAFSQIANPNAGKIRIEYTPV